jgi:hypothetical protein
MLADGCALSVENLGAPTAVLPSYQPGELRFNSHWRKEIGGAKYFPKAYPVAGYMVLFVLSNAIWVNEKVPWHVPKTRRKCRLIVFKND